MSSVHYWMAVISKEHVQRGVAGGFVQVCHGKEAPLKRMNPNDWLIIYSPKLQMEGTEKCQTFTAIGQVKDDQVYPFQMSPGFIPFRRNIEFISCQEIPILPLIPQLGFIQDKKKWGYPFRFGFFQIQEADFHLIASNMLNHERTRQPVSI